MRLRGLDFDALEARLRLQDVRSDQDAYYERQERRALGLAFAVVVHSRRPIRTLGTSPSFTATRTSTSPRIRITPAACAGTGHKPPSRAVTDASCAFPSGRRRRSRNAPG